VVDSSDPENLAVSSDTFSEFITHEDMLFDDVTLSIEIPRPSYKYCGPVYNVMSDGCCVFCVGGYRACHPSPGPERSSSSHLGQQAGQTCELVVVASVV